ncbi:hypothetical protein [Enterococcus columbae]|uniref:Uncharacterized protein n=1 Tax=Enterococcus columbae DSM 7374 = ATCC 51263 TaxID=1121865 RepID=S0KWT1_9ENTE|nr:hypothetical protein [Enterococcus columbae]EOT44573.1 hypothetical protein OMW_00629 [Enterococcus columbae DSM 7374 = ATCC 51263]EOW87531.1 hypothetical protein I568_00575 [Enterococcus columbae DSM 7374 = ATCC 51263]
MTRLSIRLNKQSLEIIEKNQKRLNGSKAEIINRLIMDSEKDRETVEQLLVKLEEIEKKERTLLRELEKKIHIIYQILNTILQYQGMKHFYSTTQAKSEVLVDAELYVQQQIHQKIMKQFEEQQ